MSYTDLLYLTAIGLICVYILIQCLHSAVLLFFEGDQPEKALADNELPHISILVAARNEEQNIERCLAALTAMDYPAEKMEILIGDDSSEDRTGEIARRFGGEHPAVTVYTITENVGKARGKANVLAQLARYAKGSYYLITDADIAVNTEWAREIVSYFDGRTGIVSGVTIVEDRDTTMGRMQEIDWMYFMGLLKSFYELGLHCTAVGNNMAIRKRAYDETGGYESIDFSITEDYKLYKEVRKREWKTKNILNERMINRSRAIHDFGSLMNQRKRWLTGARELPFYWWVIFGIFGLFGPAIVVVAIFNIKLALIFYFVKLALQSLSVYVLQEKMNVRKNFDYLLAYEIYSIVVALGTQIYYFLPVSVKWKRRSYR